jgi:hypothetical protein
MGSIRVRTFRKDGTEFEAENFLVKRTRETEAVYKLLERKSHEGDKNFLEHNRNPEFHFLPDVH